MTNLTKKLKKGKLPDGTYYFKSPNGEIDIGTDFRIAILFMCNDYDKIEVLEQVPSYEQWQTKLEENTKLKELLKECQDEIEYLRKHYKGSIDHFKNNTRLDKEINQALGEE